MVKNIEFQLLDGCTKVLSIDPERVYNITGHTAKECVFDRKFPFVHVESVSYVRFRYQFSSYRSDLCDDTEYVRMSLAEFMQLLGIDYMPYEEAKLIAAIKTG